MSNNSLLRHYKNYNTLETEEIAEYILKPTSEAQKWLLEGFRPFGSPLFRNDREETYQAFIKPERLFLDERLKGKEGICIHLQEQGHKPYDIARMLNLSPKTVANYLWNAKRKLRE